MTTNPANLLPCPFCGGTPDFDGEDGISMDTGRLLLRYVHCLTCGADVPGEGRFEAQLAWNKRRKQWPQ